MTKNKSCNNCRYDLQIADSYPCKACIYAICTGKGRYTRWEPKDDDKTPEDEPIEDEHYDSHYSGAVQPIEFMQAQMQPSEFIGFLKGNIIKYIARMGKKDDPAKEVAKIKRYAEWLEKALMGEKIDPRD